MGQGKPTNKAKCVDAEHAMRSLLLSAYVNINEIACIGRDDHATISGGVVSVGDAPDAAPTYASAVESRLYNARNRTQGHTPGST